MARRAKSKSKALLQRGWSRGSDAGATGRELAPQSNVRAPEMGVPATGKAEGWEEGVHVVCFHPTIQVLMLPAWQEVKSVSSGSTKPDRPRTEGSRVQIPGWEWKDCVNSRIPGCEPLGALLWTFILLPALFTLRHRGWYFIHETRTGRWFFLFNATKKRSS